MADVWGDSDDEDERPQQPAAARDERQLRQKHYNEGYKDSLKQAREAALQGGFNKGFKQGFTQGLRAGRIIGVSSTVLDVDSGLCKASDTASMQRILEEAKALTKSTTLKDEEFITKVDDLDARIKPLLAPAFSSVLETKM